MVRREGMVSGSRTLLSTLSLTLAYAGVMLAALGPGLAHFALVSPMTGFLLFGLGLGLGVLAFALGGVALLVGRRGPPGARARAWLATGLGAVLAGILLLLVPRARDHPINDVVTAPDDPPQFEMALRDPTLEGRDLSYPGERFASLQRRLYPDLAPIELELPPKRAFQRAERAAESLGWELRMSDPERGLLEATDTSWLFRFVDDIVVRVRPANGGSRVDVRSRSRDGKSDLGANAARIRAFAAALREETKPAARD